MGLAIGLGCALGVMLGSEAGQAGWETVTRALQAKQAEAVDWSAYYKGYTIGTDGQRIPFAPQFVSPAMQWAVPNSCLNGPPSVPPGLLPALDR